MIQKSSHLLDSDGFPPPMASSWCEKPAMSKTDKDGVGDLSALWIFAVSPLSEQKWQQLTSPFAWSRWLTDQFSFEISMKHSKPTRKEASSTRTENSYIKTIGIVSALLDSQSFSYLFTRTHQNDVRRRTTLAFLPGLQMEMLTTFIMDDIQGCLYRQLTALGGRYLPLSTCAHCHRYDKDNTCTRGKGIWAYWSLQAFGWSL